MASVDDVVSRVKICFLAFVSRICLIWLDSDGTVVARMKYRFTSAQESYGYTAYSYSVSYT